MTEVDPTGRMARLKQLLDSKGVEYHDQELQPLLDGGWEYGSRLAIATAEELVAGRVPPGLAKVLVTAFAAGGSGAGVGTAVAGGNGEGANTATVDAISRRLPEASKYAAYIIINPPGQEPFKLAATVLNSRIIVTFAHKVYANTEHTSWYWPLDKHKTVQVYVYDGGSGHCRPVSCTALGHNDTMDLAALEACEELSEPDLDTALFPGQDYFVLGQSTQACKDTSSVAHGKISATCPDIYMHVRGDMESGVGDSGGPVFAVGTGKLIGICVGNDDKARRAVLVPTAEAIVFVQMCGQHCG